MENVRRTIESLERQNERLGWEHILIDGASSDGTPAWYNSAGFAFPHRLISEPDAGIFDAMNKSLNIATGAYVVFMNAGDRYVDVDALGRVLRRLEAQPMWGYSRARMVDRSGQRVRPEVGKIPFSRIIHLFGIAKMCHQTVVMRLDLLREMKGFDLRMGNAADYHLLIKAAALTPPVTWADVDVDYLVGGVSDLQVFDQLWLGHRARVDALNLNPVGVQLDRAWTALQILHIRTRKKLKPLLGPIYLRLHR